MKERQDKIRFSQSKFHGSYYAASGQMKTQVAPKTVKVLMALFFGIMFGGVCLVIALGIAGQPSSLVTAVGLMVLGLALLVMGLLLNAFLAKPKGKKINGISLTFLLVGGGITLVGLLLLFLNPMRLFSLLGLFGLPLLFLVLGIVLLAVQIRGRNRLRARCSHPVQAVCVYTQRPANLKKRDRHHTQVLSTAHVSSLVARPVWEYYYNGQKFEAAMDDYRGSLKEKPGDERQLFIDPADPKVMYDPALALNKAAVATCISFIVLGVVVLVGAGLAYPFLSSLLPGAAAF